MPQASPDRWFRSHLPLDGEALEELMAGEMIDVHSALPTFTAMFQVRVQVFSQAETLIAPPGLAPGADELVLDLPRADYQITARALPTSAGTYLPSVAQHT